MGLEPLRRELLLLFGPDTTPIEIKVSLPPGPRTTFIRRTRPDKNLLEADVSFLLWLDMNFFRKGNVLAIRTYWLEVEEVW